MTKPEEKKQSKVLLGLYITFCVLFMVWLTSRFFKGRRQLHQAFDTIGMQLQRLQDQLEQRRALDEGRMIEYSNGTEEKDLKTDVDTCDAQNDKIKEE